MTRASALCSTCSTRCMGCGTRCGRWARPSRLCQSRCDRKSLPGSAARRRRFPWPGTARLLRADRARRAMVLRLDPAALARQRRLNRLHSVLLLVSLSGLAGWTGLLVGGPEGLAFGFGMVLAFLLLN